MEPKTALDYLQNIPFAVTSMAELCTEPGSYQREVARRVAASVRADIERAIELLRMEAQKS